MSYINLQVIGNVGRVNELKTTQSGKQVLSFTLAANERFGNESRTTWCEVTAWNGLANMLEQHLVQGQKVMVNGRPDTRVWIDQSGVTHASLVLTASEFRFLGSKPPVKEYPHHDNA